MQPRDVASCGDTTVAGLISEQSECYASPLTAVIHVPRNAHLLDVRGRLNVGDYAALCWPVLERLTAAKRSSRHAVVSLQWTDLREAAEHEEIRVNGTAVTGRRPPLPGA